MDDTWRGEETPRLNRTNEILSRECTGIEATWTHRSFDLHLTAVLHRDRSLIGRSRSSIYLSFIGRRRRIMEELRDRGAIEPRSWSFWRGIILTGLENGRSSSRITIVARSWPDRGAIVASFLKQSQPNKPLIPGQFTVTLKPCSMPIESHPLRCKSAPMNRSITHDLRVNFLL